MDILIEVVLTSHLPQNNLLMMWHLLPEVSDWRRTEVLSQFGISVRMAKLSIDHTIVFHISGHTDMVPCKLPRKQASPRQQKKDVLRTGFSVERIEDDYYYGFNLTGDGRYLLSDFTVTHNSVLAALCARISKKRTGVLTATKALQDQFLKDFYSVGFLDVRGQNSYPCILVPEAHLRVDQGPCHAGVTCPLRETTCIYYSELAKAAKSQYVVTNYSFWLAQANTFARRGGGIGRFGLVIMDEADEAFGAIESYLETHISVEECRQAGVRLPERTSFPEAWEEWIEWAHECLPKVERLERSLRGEFQEHEQTDDIDVGHSAEDAIRKPRVKSNLDRVRGLQDLIRKLSLIKSSLGQWVWKTTGGGRDGGGFGILFTPVLAGTVRQPHLRWGAEGSDHVRYSDT